jgi:CubicO group peptidase (beta-lactamase class C family)
MSRYLLKNALLRVLIPAGITAPIASAASAEKPSRPKLPADASIERVLDLHAFFRAPENKVKIQFPSPETHYAWQNMSRFYPTAQIMRDGRIRELPVKLDPSIDKVTFQKSDGRTETVKSHIASYPVDAFLVVRGGAIVFELYKAMRPIDKHNWFSASKVTGSMVLAILEAEDKVDVKKPVTAYLPELNGSVWDTVTVEETLDMATGLDSTEHDEPNHDSRTNPDQGWFKWAASLGILPDVHNLNQTPFDVLRQMKRRKPGHTRFEYNSIDTFTVNRIVEAVTGKPLSEVFADRIWRKIGAEHDAFVAVTAQGYPLQFGFISSTLRDMARFGMIFTPSLDKVSDERIIPGKVVRMIQTTGGPEIYADNYVGNKMLKNFPGETGMTNRYQWDAIFKDGDMYKAGVGGQGLYVSPSRDTVIAWFCTGDGENQEETMARAIAKSFDAK